MIGLQPLPDGILGRARVQPAGPTNHQHDNQHVHRLVEQQEQLRDPSATLRVLRDPSAMLRVLRDAGLYLANLGARNVDRHVRHTDEQYIGPSGRRKGQGTLQT